MSQNIELLNQITPKTPLGLNYYEDILLLSPQNTIREIVTMAEEGLLSHREAVERINPEQIEALLHTQLDARFEEYYNRIIGRGINASPGAATGRVFFSVERAKQCMAQLNEPIIFVHRDLKPEDIDSISVASGWLVSQGGATSHAAVVARQKGIPCVTGIRELIIDKENQTFTIDKHVVSEGDWISIDGSTGLVLDGYSEIQELHFEEEPYLLKLLEWADEIRKIDVRANADTVEDAILARRLGAQGNGVCRTEHMFLDDNVLPHVQQLILANEISEIVATPTEEIERILLEKLLPQQRDNFVQIFDAMSPYPVIIRLLDLPINEFLSNQERLLRNLNSNGSWNLTEKHLLDIVSRVQDTNPMLGFRGVRLGLLRPQIYEMQVRAIIEAACHLVKRGKQVFPEIMIPLVSYSQELQKMKVYVERTATQVMEEQNCNIRYFFGTMIESPRAAIIAHKIAEYAEFFSFGTNDLTQTTAGISRDDAENKFLLHYVDQGIITENPFQKLDFEGVGYLIKLGTDKGKEKRREMGYDLEVGICGEHGGDVESVHFCHKIGLDYVSCSPLRVPIARLAAAHAVLRETDNTYL